MPGRVVSLHLKTGHGEPMRQVQRVVAVAGQGLEGDASFGRPRRQVLLVEEAMLAEFGLQPGQTRENIVLSGIALPDLTPGAHLRVGEALLEVTGDCAPCTFMDSLRPGLREAVRGKRGVLARVREGGTIRVADPAALLTECCD